MVEVIQGLPIDEIVLDGEILALQKSGRPHPFQVTMRRFGRTLDVEVMLRRISSLRNEVDHVIVSPHWGEERFLIPSPVQIEQARALAAYRGDDALRARIEELASKHTEGELTDSEQAEYEGHVQANQFIAILQAKAKKLLDNGSSA